MDDILKLKVGDRVLITDLSLGAPDGVVTAIDVDTGTVHVLLHGNEMTSRFSIRDVEVLGDKKKEPHRIPFDPSESMPIGMPIGQCFRKCFKPKPEMAEFFGCDPDPHVRPICRNCKYEDKCEEVVKKVLEHFHKPQEMEQDPAKIAHAAEIAKSNVNFCIDGNIQTETFYVICTKDRFGRWSRLNVDMQNYDQIMDMALRNDCYWEADGREYAVFERTISIVDHMVNPAVRYHDVLVARDEKDQALADAIAAGAHPNVLNT